MTDSAADISTHFNRAMTRAETFSAPYRHWLLRDVFPAQTLAELKTLSFPVGALDGVSGKRELHNDTRSYFDQENIARLPAVAAISNAFQSTALVRAIADFFGADLDDTFLRIEFAQDVSGFWLEPHTDLGVKRLTVLIYLSDGDGHETLGTDIFNADKSWAKRSPFAPNAAMAFVPGDNTYHGFQERKINGVRRSLILNYVTQDLRDREQLAFPDETVRCA